MRHLSAGIAWRYLWKKKSHGAVSAIAIVSVVGVAVATAAIICVLSVFNGFREVLVGQNDKVLPDVEVTLKGGRVILPGDSLAEAIGRIEGVELSSPVVADQALAIFNMQEMPVMLRGVVPADFARYSDEDSLIVSGRSLPADAISHEPPYGLLSIGVGMKLRAYAEGDNLFLFAPRRHGRLNPANPAASFFTDSIVSCGIIETRQSEIDLNSVYVPIELARGLFQYETEATSIAIKARKGVDAARLAERISEAVGPDYDVKDRGRQQEINFRMVQIEKWVTGLLLMFILVIASFNIISTLTMFVLEKQRSMRTLRALGMSSRRIGNIFGWESLYVTLSGALAGIGLGIGLCLAQERWGWIKMYGDAEEAILRTYPVRLEWGDMWMVVVPVLLIGAITSLIAASFARSRIAETRQ